MHIYGIRIKQSTQSEGHFLKDSYGFSSCGKEMKKGCEFIDVLRGKMNKELRKFKHIE